MKPRISWVNNWWHPEGSWECATRLFFGYRLGHGKTPQEAYLNWCNWTLPRYKWPI